MTMTIQSPGLPPIAPGTRRAGTHADPGGDPPLLRNATVTCPSWAPSRLTASAVAAARAVGSRGFHLCATLDTTPPRSTAGSVMLLRWFVRAADLAPVDLFPAVGAAVHLGAWPKSAAADVSV